MQQKQNIKKDTIKPKSIGYANRGRDANIEEGIATINLIQKEPYGWFKKVIQDGREVITNADSNEEGAFQRFETSQFVSCKRQVYDYQRTRRCDGSFADVNNVNLKIYEDEYMSVMWLNSNYIREWIDAKHIGDWHEGNYTYIVPKLKELKQYIQKREEAESEMFTSILPEFIYTAAKKDEVLDWRVKNKVRRLTSFQARRFLKAERKKINEKRLKEYE